MSLALVIPAAGASARLGTCKALVRLGPRTALAHLLRAAAELAGPPPLVVTGAHHAQIAAAAPDGVEILENADWAAGRTGGLQLARRARLGHDLLIAPVDCPLVPRAVFDALRAAWARGGAPARGWLAPRLAAPGTPGTRRYGHPLVLGRGLAEELEGLAPDAPLRSLRSTAAPAWGVCVPHPEILDDLDRPSDLARLADRASGGGDRPPK